MTVPASAIPGPQVSYDDLQQADPSTSADGDRDSSVSRNFLANLQHLATLKDKADLVQYGIMLMVEIATLEERVTDLQASIAEEVEIAKHEMQSQYEGIIAQLEAKVKADG